MIWQNQNKFELQMLFTLDTNIFQNCLLQILKCQSFEMHQSIWVKKKFIEESKKEQRQNEFQDQTSKHSLERQLLDLKKGTSYQIMWLQLQATLQCFTNFEKKIRINGLNKNLRAVRFELTRVSPADLESAALDRSAKHALLNFYVSPHNLDRSPLSVILALLPLSIYRLE